MSQIFFMELQGGLIKIFRVGSKMALPQRPAQSYLEES
jgi:hypothetical protein